MISVSVNGEDVSKLIFFVSENNEISVDASDRATNLIDGAFTKLQVLYFSSSLVISKEYCIGCLIGCPDNQDGCIGSVLPLTTLDSLLDDVLKPQMLTAFLDVCNCILGGLIVRDNFRATTGPGKVDVPASAIWGLLIFAEVLGVADVYQTCIERLQKMQKRSSGSDVPALPSSVMSAFPPEHVDAIEQNIHRHLQRYHTEPSTLPPPPPSPPAQRAPMPAYPPASHYATPVPAMEPFASARSDHAERRSVGGSTGSSGSRSVGTDVGYDSDTQDTVGDEGLAGWREHSRDFSRTSDLGQGPPAHLSHGPPSSSLPRSSSPAPFGSVTPRFHAPFASAAPPAPRLPVTPTPRFARRPAQEGDGRSPGTDLEDGSDSPQAGSKPALTAEDLRISREIAKMRLQEAKIREELEASKLQAEREATQARLKFLQLNAEAARQGRPKSPARQDRSSVVAANTRFNARPSTPVTPARSTPAQVGRLAAPATVLGAQTRDRSVAEQARLMAVKRVREAKKKEEQLEMARRSAEQTKEDQKWSVRDKKLEEFRRRQAGPGVGAVMEEARGAEETDHVGGMSAHWLQGKSGNPMPLQAQRSPQATRQSGASAYRVVSRLRYAGTEVTDADLTDRDGAASLEEVHQGDYLYTAEAMQAVGLGLSPALKPPSSHSSAPASPLPPAAPAAPSTMVSVKVIRAWDLPEELGGTTAYVVMDWGRWGKAHTQAVRDTTAPQFGATLMFKSPCAQLGVEDGRAAAGLMKVYAYNRNQSVSDEVIACGEFDPLEHLEEYGAAEPLVLPLYRERGMEPAGCVELVVSEWAGRGGVKVVILNFPAEYSSGKQSIS